jgi:hypothetical protein
MKIRWLGNNKRAISCADPCACGGRRQQNNQCCASRYAFFGLFALASKLAALPNKKCFLSEALICFVAEREGFEPPDLLQSTVFKTAALNRSAISPAQK